MKVTTAPAELGLLYGWFCVKAGASNENVSSFDPTTFPIVTAMRCPTEFPARDWQVRLVPETYAVVSHWLGPIREVAEPSMKPKFVPSSVILAPPAVGPLVTATVVITGASNVNVPHIVLITELMVRVESSPLPVPGVVLETTEVTEVHVTVVSCVAPSTIVGVLSLPPKFIPCSVIRTPPEGAPLTPFTSLTIGLSKENQFAFAVPISPPIVIPTALLILPATMGIFDGAAGTVQKRLVAELQPVVRHE